MIFQNEFIEEYGDIVGIGEVLGIITTSNLGIFKCVKYMFKKKKYKISIGGYIVLFSIAFCIGLGILFYLRDLKIIKKYMITKTTSYLNYLSENSVDPEDKKIAKIKSDLSKNKIEIDIKNSFSKPKNQNRQNVKISSGDKHIL